MPDPSFSPDVALVMYMAQTCPLAKGDRSRCCLIRDLPSNGTKVSHDAVAKIDRLIVVEGSGANEGEVPPTAAAGDDMGSCGTGGKASAEHQPVALPQPPQPVTAAEGAVRSHGESGVALAMDRHVPSPLSAVTTDTADPSFAAAEPRDASPPPASAAQAGVTTKKREASADGGATQDSAVAAAAAAAAAGISSPSRPPPLTDEAGGSPSQPPRFKRSRRVVGRDLVPREQRVYYTCGACGHDRNHIRKRTCGRCRAPKSAPPSGATATASRGARRAGASAAAGATGQPDEGARGKTLVGGPGRWDTSGAYGGQSFFLSSAAPAAGPSGRVRLVVGVGAPFAPSAAPLASQPVSPAGGAGGAPPDLR